MPSSRLSANALVRESELHALQGVTMPYKPPLVWAHGVLHWSLTLVLLGLGIDCLAPGNMMSNLNGWSFFLKWTDESNWGYVFLGVGSIGIIGAESGRAWLRVASVLILATVHILVALMFIAANPAAAGSFLFTIFAGQGYYLLYRYTRKTRF